MEVQDIIKEKRIALNLTMKEVADYVGVTEATISRWESGDIANMRRDRIYKLSQVLNLSPLVIMGIEEEQHPVEEELPQDKKDLIELVKTLSPEEVAAVLRILRR